MKSFLYVFSFVLFSGSISSEIKKENPNRPDHPVGTIEFIFIPMVGSKPLYMDSFYFSPAGQKYSLKNFKFFVSNIALAKSIGAECTAITNTPTDIYLIDFVEPNFNEGQGKQSFKITFKVSAGQYTDIRFDVGVPRQLNHADPTTAKFPLDLGRGDMYWDWNSGYIFLLAEGKGPDLFKNSFHIALGDDSRIMPLKFGNLFDVIPKIKVEEGKTSQIRFSFDFNKLLINGDGSKHTFKTFESSNVHGGYYADMFRLNALNAMEFISVK